MKKSIHRAICFLFAVLAVCALFPVSAFAVDPVSAGVMANAFAQAIAAYGASNGVAMTFDVANTDGIGETVHELWKDFRDGTQDADDYATLAAALFPDLYYKASAVVGGVADVYSVGYNITAEYAEEFDNFYNWLLSGPAEMVKVDNQYYEFSQNQIGPDAVPVNIISVGFTDQPIPVLSGNTDVSSSLVVGNYGTSGNLHTYLGSAGEPVYCFTWTSGYTYWYFVSPSSDAVAYYKLNTSSVPSSLDTISLTQTNSSTHLYFQRASTSRYSGDYGVPSVSSPQDGFDAIAAGAPTDTIGVKAYTNTGVADFPDTADPNYDATHRAKQIPSSIPWDDALYGDGTGTLTDAQSGAIAAEADAAIADDGILTLAGSTTANPDPGDPDDDPSDDPDDYLAVGLEDFFPFCIPFDIYNFLSALAADPVAPHFTATLDFPEAVGGTQTIELDFDSPTWNQLAQLLRLLELLAFIVGLALLTRSMFIRG